MDDSLTYIEALSSQYHGNLDNFLEQTRSRIEKGKLNLNVEYDHDPLR